MIRLLLLILLSTPLLSQSQLYLNISNGWRFSGPMATATTAMAQPDFDDSGWRPVNPTDRLIETGWLRRSVDLPEWADRTQLALTIGPVRERYALYVNGQEIARVGDFETFSTAHLAQTRTFSIPPNITANGNRLAIAIQLAPMATSPPWWHPPDREPFLLTYLANAPIGAGAERLRLHRSRLTPTLVMSVIFLIFGIQLLLAWLRERDRPELLWLAAFLLASFVYGAQTVLTVSPHSTPYNHSGAPWINQITRAATWVTLTSFVITALRFRLFWLHAVLWLGSIAFAAYLAAGQNSFSSYMSLGLVTSVCALAVIATAWWSSAKEQAPFSQHLFLFILTLNALDKAVLMVDWVLHPARERLAQFVPLGDYYLILSDPPALILAISILVLLLRQVASDRQHRLRLSGEMSAAQEAQRFLLGHGTSINAAPFLIDPVYKPAIEVGGDLYQILDRGSSKLVLVGDVSGKGLKAAMMASLACGALQHDDSASPAEVLHRLNRTLAGRGAGFITCCCVRLDPDGRATIANAGHPAPYLNRREVELEPGLPLGVTADVTYAETLLTLAPGDQLTLVSDGVVEAANGAGELFGFDRTREISGKSAQQIADAATAWGQNDDITVVTVRRTA